MDEHSVVLAEVLMCLENKRCSYSTVTSVGVRVTDFSCVAVPMFVPAKKDGRNLASHIFPELYQLFLILLLFTSFSFAIINLI